jgi:hypothetical protein
MVSWPERVASNAGLVVKSWNHEIEPRHCGYVEVKARGGRQGCKQANRGVKGESWVWHQAGCGVVGALDHSDHGWNEQFG